MNAHEILASLARMRAARKPELTMMQAVARDKERAVARLNALRASASTGTLHTMERDMLARTVALRVTPIRFASALQRAAS